MNYSKVSSSQITCVAAIKRPEEKSIKSSLMLINSQQNLQLPPKRIFDQLQGQSWVLFRLSEPAFDDLNGNEIKEPINANRNTAALIDL